MWKNWNILQKIFSVLQIIVLGAVGVFVFNFSVLTIEIVEMTAALIFLGLLFCSFVDNALGSGRYILDNISQFFIFMAIGVGAIVNFSFVINLALSTLHP